MLSAHHCFTPRAKLAEDTPERIQKHPEVIKTYLGSGLC